MNFTTKKIHPKTVGIIDIGTYKIRVGICLFQNSELNLIGYGEKRQNADDIHMQEYVNIEGICGTIKSAIKKAEEDAGTKVTEVIINVPFDELFFETTKVNHTRSNTEKISKEELYSIIKGVQKKSLAKHYKKIKKISGYQQENIKLIMSGVENIMADKIQVSKLIGLSPTEINLTLIHVFIPEEKHELVQEIERGIGKKIIKIIPSEIAITNIFRQKKNIVIIDFGCSHTGIIVKKDGRLMGVKKVPVGIDNLIQTIKEKNNLTKIEIISSIDEEKYLDEKNEFLQIFKDVLIVTLEEIMGENLCPNDFYMIGGGSNHFVQKFLEQSNLNKGNLKIAQQLHFTDPNLEHLKTTDLSIQAKNNISKSNLNIYSMMITTLEFMKNSKDPIEESLKKALSDIENK